MTPMTTLPRDRKASRQEDFGFSQLLLVLKKRFLIGGTKETQTILSLSESPKNKPHSTALALGLRQGDGSETEEQSAAAGPAQPTH